MSQSPAPELRRKPFEYGTQLELFLGEAAVSGVAVWDLPMQIGSAVVRLGGIGGVYTRREHRLHGYSRRVIEESLAFMRDEGYHLSALFGIENYYPKYGYATSLVESQSTVATRDALDAEARLAVRDYTPTDAPAVAAIYGAMTASRSGAIVRHPATWGGHRLAAHWSDRFGALVIEDGGRVVGYATYNLNLDEFAIAEVGYAGPRVYETLLAEAARLAHDRALEKIIFHLPPDDPFALYLRRYGCATEIRYNRRAGGMARIIDQAALFALLAPALAARLEALPPHGRPAGGTVMWRTDLGETRTPLGGAGEWVVAMPQARLTQLLLGYRAIDDLLGEADVQVDAAALPLLRAICPAGYPYVWPGDRF
jgi:predicted acetyltransferase